MRTVEENGGVGSNRHSAPGRKHSALSPCAAIPTIFTPREIDIKLPCKGSTQLRGIPFRAPWSAPETSKAKEVESDSQCGSRVWLFRSRAMSAIPAITAIRTPSPHGSTAKIYLTDHAQNAIFTAWKRQRHFRKQSSTSATLRIAANS
jgi:hypothetical protein